MINLSVVAYINGVRFHPRSVSVTAAVGQTLTFSLDVTPVPEWAMLPPRSHVAVFFTDPVTQEWRLLCEGETVARGRAKLGTGARSRQISCRGPNGFWDTTPFANLFGAVFEGSHSTTGRLQAAQANGMAVVGKDTDQPVASLTALMSSVITRAGGQYPAMLTTLANTLARQANVEAFYSRSRQIDKKIYALPDAEIDKYVNAAFTADVIKNGFNAFGFTTQMMLSQVVRQYEYLAFYQHVPLLSPPHAGDRLPEVLFVPTLTNTVPPACNVIFNTQVVGLTAALDEINRPTRVITTVRFGLATETPIPVLYMANSLRASDNQIGVASEKLTACQKAVYSLLSPEELETGVVTRYETWPIEKVQPSAGEPSDLADYMNALARYLYDNAHAAAATQDLQLAFQPYLAPGFPCLVEDGDTPLYGYLQSVTHQLPSGGTPSTSVHVSRSRELFLQDGAYEPPKPPWLNSRFAPAQVADTYRSLFGANLIGSDGYAAAVPDKALVTADGETFSMAKAMGAALNVPSYAEDGTSRGLVGGGGSASAALMVSPDAQATALEYQYRSGTSLADYCRLHGLELPAGTEPPERLVPKGSSPNKLFAAPAGLRYMRSQSELPAEDTGNVYGFYELQRGSDGELLSSRRQDVAEAIAASIARGITDDTR